MTNNVHLAIMEWHLIVRILMGTLIHFNFEIVTHIQEAALFFIADLKTQNVYHRIFWQMCISSQFCVFHRIFSAIKYKNILRRKTTYFCDEKQHI